MHIREHVYYFLEPGDDTGRVVDGAIVVLIFLNIVALMLETVESVYSAHKAAFTLFEGISVAVFSVEYILRIWSCTTNLRYAHPISGRLRFIVSPLGVIDLLAILPFFLQMKFRNLFPGMRYQLRIPAGKIIDKMDW